MGNHLQWNDSQEGLILKTLIIPIIYTGVYTGEILGFPLSSALVSSKYGWSSVFYAFGLVGILWYPFWSYNSYERPERHPSITAQEIEFIYRGKSRPQLSTTSGAAAYNPPVAAPGASDAASAVGTCSTVDALHEPLADSSEKAARSEKPDKERDVEKGAEVARRTPWTVFFTHPAALVLLVNNWTVDYIAFTLLSDLPTYLTDQLGFSEDDAGYLSMVPYVALLGSTLFYGYLFEHLQLHHGWSARKVRQWSQFLTIGMTSLCLIIGGSLSDHKNASFAFIVISQLFFGADASGIGCAYSDITPQYSDVLNTIGKTVGALAGIVAPLLVVALWQVCDHSAWGWRADFFLIGAMSAVSLWLWRRFQTSDIVAELDNPLAVAEGDKDQCDWWCICKAYVTRRSCFDKPLLDSQGNSAK